MKVENEYPSYSGICTFMRADYKERKDLKEGDYAIIGVPYDTTLGSRPGCRYAPRNIREQSIHFIYHLSAIDKEVIDVTTKKRMKYPPKDILFDTGDARVYTSDVEKTIQSVAGEIETIIDKGATPVIIGGDHFITYPCIKGLEAGLKKKKKDVKIGYIHIDSHLDFYNESETWGKYWHGSFARRVSELDSIDISNMVWVGINGTTGVECYEHLIKNGGTIFTAEDINQQGMKNVMEKAFELAGDGCDYVYVTMDIDAVDNAFAPGTGAYVCGGITSMQFMDAVDVIAAHKNVVGIDLVEVAPNLDPTERTMRLAAGALTAFLKPRLFEITEPEK